LSGKDRLDLYYSGPGHTNGDVVIVFPALRIAHTGDLFAGKNPPRIDPGTGGSGVAYPQTVAKVVAGISNVDTIITGHNPVSTWKDLEEFARFNQDFVSAVRAASISSSVARRSGRDASASRSRTASFTSSGRTRSPSPRIWCNEFRASTTSTVTPTSGRRRRACCARRE
jgi:glyoxylase-like metal-dependent hydrolase (beta-lactamase superfamily II)